MERITLLETFKRFEYQPTKVYIENDLQTFEYQPTKSYIENDLRTIKNDLNRTDFSFSPASRSSEISKFYLFVLEKDFIDLPLIYFQGMLEIACVILDAYFLDIVENKNDDSQSIIRVKIEDITEEEKSKFEDLLNKHQETHKKFKNCITNVLNENFLFLAKHNFEKFNLFNKKFITMMNSNFMKSKNNNWKVDSLTSIMNLDHILMFFKRLSKNREVVFTLFNLILNSDPSIVFSILAFYIDKGNVFKGTNSISNHEGRSEHLISNVSEMDLKKIIKIHDSFLNEKYLKDDYDFLSITLIAGLCIGILTYFIISFCKKSKKNSCI